MTKHVNMFALLISLVTPSSIASLPSVEALRALPTFERWVAHTPVALPFATSHPQGLIKVGTQFFLTTVDRSKDLGGIIRFSMSGDGAVNEMMRGDLKEGKRYHPGGIDLNPNNGKLWVPLAEYRSKSSTSLIEIDVDTLKPRKIAELRDHIGTIIYDVTANIARLINWGTDDVYSVPLAHDGACPPGRLSEQPFNSGNVSGGYEYQDCKFIGRSLALCAGVRGLLSQSGVLDVVQFGKSENRRSPFEIIRRVPVPSVESQGKSKPLTMNPMSYESMKNVDGKPILRLHFVPHDGPRSMLYTYDVPLEEPVPGP